MLGNHCIVPDNHSSWGYSITFDKEYYKLLYSTTRKLTSYIGTYV